MKNVIITALVALGLTSCGKNFIENEDQKYLDLNREEIRAFNEANSLGLEENVATGIFFKKLVEVESPVYPEGDVTLHIAFKLSTLDGKELINVTAEDSSFFAASSSSSVFQGFVIALSSLGEGEKGIFYLPSPLVYGANPPDNFPLDPWEVTVLEMENIKFYGEEDFIDLFISMNNLASPEVTDKGVRIVRNDDRPADGDLVVGDVVKVKYKGYFLNKTTFDEGEFEVSLGSGSVIPGFDDGLLNMRVGEKATLIIPWSLGYGEAGSGSIPGKTTLAFDVEVVSKSN
ncbi:FKBP-type peptidyl-prolyl cis-trans isomerase [uncultured Arcticibacterium sp.]|uniref:FKBP-type peptidyl-prolyl cis-trans isomerase n=1 Tax=uncultured Arcticibacterium sp. TaxID=2173042 RepID=UPI0030F4EE95